MTAAGWIIAISSWTLILALNAFCFYRLFTEKPAEDVTHEEAGHRDTEHTEQTGSGPSCP